MSKLRNLVRIIIHQTRYFIGYSETLAGAGNFKRVRYLHVLCMCTDVFFIDLHRECDGT
jgi:hypothetical protein